jgi:hypothetical protein
MKMRAPIVASVVTLLFAASAFAADPVVPVRAAPSARLDQLAWMAGDWGGPDGTAAVEEHWLAPKGGLMLGLGRTVKDGKAVDFEFMRIEQQGETLVFLASPGGKAATPFALVETGATRAVFEGAPEFPRRISYRRNADGSLTARIEGTRDGKPASKEWTWRRMARE